jgi:transcriptional regulator with XRE-family HTH domain
MEKQLTLLMEHYGLSSAQFADKIGVQRSSISHILSGRNKPSYDFLQKITNTFKNVDANWLINGVGSIEKKSENNIISAKEKDLFSQQLNTPDVETKNIVTERSESNKIVENQPINITQNTINQGINTEFTNVNSMKQIILIFENNTFEIINKK